VFYAEISDLILLVVFIDSGIDGLYLTETCTSENKMRPNWQCDSAGQDLGHSTRNSNQIEKKMINMTRKELLNLFGGKGLKWENI
jgi:hypothetical protein